MNDDSLDDPQLRSLEARLASAAIHIPAAEQQALLYQCAFAAGQKAANRRLRRWQAAAATCAALLLATVGLQVRDGWTTAMPIVATTVPANPPPRQSIEPDEIPRAAQWPTAIALDAWQLHPRENAAVLGEIALLDDIDPRLRALTVGALTRQAFKP
jgi:hypothetical protein